MMDELVELATPAVKKGSDRRQHIVNAALQCLQNQGYAQLTARKVAAEAGISLGNITYYFDSMDALLCEAYELATAHLSQASQIPTGKGGRTPMERLEAYLWAGFSPEVLTSPLLRLRVDLMSAAIENPKLAQIERALYQHHRETLEALLEAVGDKWKADRIPMVADLITATLDGLWVDWLRRADSSSVKNGIEGCLHFARMRLGT
ncbi:MAG: TetR/AcrR family transcriptional regulator [Microgenomates group bacterium]